MPWSIVGYKINIFSLILENCLNVKVEICLDAEAYRWISQFYFTIASTCSLVTKFSIENAVIWFPRSLSDAPT